MRIIKILYYETLLKEVFLILKQIILNVDGMTCSHCEAAVKNSVSSLNGVSNVFVDLKNKTVTVDFDTSLITINDISSAIIDIGYDVI